MTTTPDAPRLATPSPRGPIEGDAFGELLLAQAAGESAPVIIERDDGVVFVDHEDYYSEPESSPLMDWVLPRVGHRVLDVGAGAGRSSVLLQRLGHDVVALDSSPAAIEACRNRGIEKTHLCTVEELAASSPEPFDTFLLLGANLGLIGTPEAAPAFFSALESMSAPGARILGSNLDPYATDRETNISYHEVNRSNGRYAGEITIRIRHARIATPWFKWLWLSPEELGEVAGASGWRVTDVFPDKTYGAELLLERGAAA